MSTAQLECVVRLTGPLGDRDAKPVEHADREDSPPGLNTQADITSRRPSVRRLNEMQRTKASNCIDTKDSSTDRHHSAQKMHRACMASARSLISPHAAVGTQAQQNTRLAGRRIASTRRFPSCRPTSSRTAICKAHRSSNAGHASRQHIRS